MKFFNPELPSLSEMVVRLDSSISDCFNDAATKVIVSYDAERLEVAAKRALGTKISDFLKAGDFVNTPAEEIEVALKSPFTVAEILYVGEEETMNAIERKDAELSYLSGFLTEVFMEV